MWSFKRNIVLCDEDRAYIINVLWDRVIKHIELHRPDLDYLKHRCLEELVKELLDNNYIETALNNSHCLTIKTGKRV